MTDFIIEINKAREKKKTSDDFTEKEIEQLFHFLEKNDEDEYALDFAQRWFNCTRMTLILLIVRREQGKGE